MPSALRSGVYFRWFGKQEELLKQCTLDETLTAQLYMLQSTRRRMVVERSWKGVGDGTSVAAISDLSEGGKCAGPTIIDNVHCDGTYGD